MSAPSELGLESLAETFLERDKNPRGGLDSHGYRVAPGEEPPAEEPAEEPDPKPEEELEPGAEPDVEVEEPGEEEPAVEEPDEEEPEAAEEGEYVELEMDGETRKIPLADLPNHILMHADYTKKTQALAEERKAWEAERASALAAEQETIGIVSSLAQQLQLELRRTLPSIEEMNKLREQDPGEWSARMEEIRRRQGLVQLAQRQAAEAEQRQLLEAAPRERALLIESMPEDFTPENFEEKYTGLSNWLVKPKEEGGGGLLPDEWRMIIDHRFVRLAQLAYEQAKHRQGRKEATRKAIPRIRKAVSELPRVRAGAPRVPKTAAEKSLADANRNLQARPDSTDALAAALLARDRVRGR